MRHPPGTPPQQQPGLKQRLKDDLKKPDCNKLLGGPQKANQILDHFRGIINVDNPANNATNSGGSLFGDAKNAIDSGQAWAQTPVPYNPATLQWSGTNFNTYVGSDFMNMTPSARETVMFHELLHIAKGVSWLAKSFVDMRTPNVPRLASDRLGNVYQISKDCGTALPPNY